MGILVALLMAVTPVGNVDLHASAILDMQLPDGAIIHSESGDEISISPYFGNYSALGLFEAYRVTKDKRYLDGAIAWTDWYLDHMEYNGVVFDHKGTREQYERTGKMDSTDSYPATFLMCANTRRALAGDSRFVLREQPKLFKSYRLMMATVDADGLTYARPDYPYKLTADNAEVYEALWHTRQLARALRDYEWNKQIYYARRKMEKAFEGLRGENGMYAWRMGPASGHPEVESGEFHPVGQASLMAVAFGPLGSRKGKETVKAAHNTYPDLGACNADHLYWWVMAARSARRNDIATEAFNLMGPKVAERGLAVDHAFYIQALARMKRMGGMRDTKSHRVMLGSTFIDIPRESVK